MARRNKGDEKRQARGRIVHLVAMAADAGDLADRYAGLARRIAMRYQVNDPALRHVCRRCNAYVGHARTRIHRSRIITTCACGHIRRRPLQNHDQ